MQNDIIKLLRTHKKTCANFIETGAYFDTEELTGEAKKNKYLERNKFNGYSPKEWEGKEWEDFRKYEKKERRKWQKYMLLMWLCINIFLLFAYSRAEEKDTIIATKIFAIIMNIFMLFPVILSFTNTNDELGEKLKEKRKYHYKKYHDRTTLENYKNNEEDIVIIVRKNTRHLTDFLKQKDPPEYIKQGVNYFMKWWIMHLEHLENYLLLLEEKTGGDKENTVKTPTLILGTFKPNFTSEQSVIISQLDNAKQVCKVIAQEVSQENEPNIFKKEARKKAVMANVIHRLDRTAFAVGSESEQSAEDFFLDKFKAKVPFSKRQSHTYILGGSGSGKSELLKLFLWNDIHHSSGNLVLDPHGKLTTELSALELFKKHPEKLVYITPKYNGYMPHYNPLEYRYHHIKDPKEKLKLIKFRASELANAFGVIAEKDFTSQMRNIVKSCLIVLLHHEGMRLRNLMEFMDDNENAKYIKLARQVDDYDIKNFFKEGGRFSQKSNDATKNGIYNRLYGLVTEGLAGEVLNQQKSTFDIVQPLKEGKTVLMDLDEGELSKAGAKAIGAFLVAEVVIWSKKRVEGKGRSVFVYLDEVQYFVTPILSKALAVIRKKGIHFTMANQGLFQFGEEGYPELGDSIITNTKVKIVGLVSLRKEQTKMTQATGGAVDIGKKQSKLGRGNWVLGLEGREAYIMKSENMLVAGDNLQVLGKEGYMKKNEYKAILRYQLDTYHYNEGKAQNEAQSVLKQRKQPKKKGTRTRPTNFDKF